MMKPDPRLFTFTLDRIGKAADACLFVDDTPGHVEAAQRLGIDTVLFTDAEALETELIRRGLLTASK
jgi:2-haloacid dehalogenase